MVTLSRVAALAIARGPHAALTELTAARQDPALDGHYRADAVQGHLLEMLGEHERARHHFVLAAQRTLSLPEQRYLAERVRTNRD